MLLTTELRAVLHTTLWWTVLLLTSAWVAKTIREAGRLCETIASTSCLRGTRRPRETAARKGEAGGTGETVTPALTGFGLVPLGRPVVLACMCLVGTLEPLVARAVVGRLALLLWRDRPGPLGRVRSIRCACAGRDAEGAGPSGPVGRVCSTCRESVCVVDGADEARRCACAYAEASGCGVAGCCGGRVARGCGGAAGEERDAGGLDAITRIATAVDRGLGLLGLTVMRGPGSTVLWSLKTSKVGSIEGKGGGR